MNFEQSGWMVTLLLVILGISVFVAVVVIIKTITSEARESKERAARLAEEEAEDAMISEPHVPAKPAPAPEPVHKPEPPSEIADMVDDSEGGLVEAAEVYLTYDLKDQAILSLEKHLLKNPTDKKALALLKKAEATD